MAKMRILLIAASHGRGMSPLMKQYQGLHGISDLDVYECWRSGSTIEQMELRVTRETHRMRRYSPHITLLHIGHNNLAKSDRFNPTPAKPTASMDKLWDLGQFLIKNIPETQIMISSPWPRVESKWSSPAFVMEYNNVANGMLKYLRSKARKQLAQQGTCPIVINTPELWVSSSAGLGNKLYFLEKDGLHLNERGQDLIAHKWLAIFQDPASVVLPPVCGPKGPPRRRPNRVRGGKKHKKNSK